MCAGVNSPRTLLIEPQFVSWSEPSFFTRFEVDRAIQVYGHLVSGILGGQHVREGYGVEFML